MAKQKPKIHLPYKLGKLKSKKEVKFKLANYIDKKGLPTLPATFGHENLVKSWGMLGNADYGDCVWAGAAHETIMWTREGDAVDCSFTTHGVLSDYSAVTGFDPKDPNTDQGTDMQEAASYRRKTGILDGSGKRHKIAAYLAVKPGNVYEHMIAVYLFGAVGIGIEFPASAMDQFNAGKPWTVVKRSPIEGGHYIPLVAKRTNIMCVTWGQTQGMTPDWFTKYNDESIAYVSEEALTNRKSPEGFDYDTLIADLKQLPKA